VADNRSLALLINQRVSGDTCAPAFLCTLFFPSSSKKKNYFRSPETPSAVVFTAVLIIRAYRTRVVQKPVRRRRVCVATIGGGVLAFSVRPGRRQVNDKRRKHKSRTAFIPDHTRPTGRPYPRVFLLVPLEPLSYRCFPVDGLLNLDVFTTESTFSKSISETIYSTPTGYITESKMF